MGKWVQDKAFTLSKMGTSKNFCLRNVRQAYGIGAKYANAKQAMNENKTKGTLHALSTMPTNVSVPVYTSSGIFGHVEVCSKGVYYSDGKRTTKPDNKYMWGEWLNGVRVVHYQNDTKPTIKVGDTVIVNGQGTGNSKGGGGKTKSFANRKMKVISIQNGRYGCNQYNKSGAITGWWTAGQIKKG
jgi:hypothetical protein